jgi:hypothetical protein
MESHLGEDRKFFLEVIDDLAKDAVWVERATQATPEQWARWEHRLNQIDVRLTETPTDSEEVPEYPTDQFRQAMTRVKPEELLVHRRFTAKAICKYVVREGRSHTTPYSQLIKGALERLQTIDAEIQRRIPGRGPIRPERSTPEDTTEPF